jgi:hypothetical protein
MPPVQCYPQYVLRREDYNNAHISPQSHGWPLQTVQEPDIESNGQVRGTHNISILDQARVEASRQRKDQTQESSAAPLGQERNGGPTSTHHTISVDTERAPGAAGQQTLATLPPSSIYLNSKRDLETNSDHKPSAPGN